MYGSQGSTEVTAAAHIGRSTDIEYNLCDNAIEFHVGGRQGGLYMLLDGEGAQRYADIIASAVDEWQAKEVKEDSDL